jgi:hypothetical protein
MLRPSRTASRKAIGGARPGREWAPAGDQRGRADPFRDPRFSAAFPEARFAGRAASGLKAPGGALVAPRAARASAGFLQVANPLIRRRTRPERPLCRGWGRRTCQRRAAQRATSLESDLIVLGFAALVYAWTVRRERRLRQLMLSASERAESRQVAVHWEIPQPFQAKPATTDDVDVLTGGVTL